MEVLHPVAVLAVGAFFAYLIGRLTRARALTGFIAFAALVAAGNGIYHLGQEVSEGRHPDVYRLSELDRPARPAG